MRVLVPLRRVINHLEGLGLLRKTCKEQVHAFSKIAQWHARYGLALLQAAWNEHMTASVQYRKRALKGTGGIPNQLARERAHPGGQLCLPADFDGVAAYEAVRGAPLWHVSADSAADQMFCPGPLRWQRDAHVEAILGTLERAWCELLHRSYDRFVAAYLCFLSYYPHM